MNTYTKTQGEGQASPGKAKQTPWSAAARRRLLQHEKDVVLRVEGYAADSGRDARLVRNDEIVNFDMLIVGELRVLAGLSRKTN
jgi:hypothetical protein